MGVRTPNGNPRLFNCRVSSHLGINGGGNSYAYAGLIGLLYVHSSYHCLSDMSGNSIDSGVEVDFEIEVGPISGTYDYCKFYDSAVTGGYLSTAYLPQ